MSKYSQDNELNYFPILRGNDLVIFKVEETARQLQSLQRLLVEVGGGGSKGTAELVDGGVDCEVDPSKLLPVVVLARPGMDIEKVCPSLRL